MGQEARANKMIKILITAIMIAGFSTSAAALQNQATEAACPEGRSWDKMRRWFGIPDDVNPLSEEDRLKALRAFNAMEPISDYNPAKVFIVVDPSGQGLLFFVNEAETCVELVNPIGLSVIRRWLSSLNI